MKRSIWRLKQSALCDVLLGQHLAHIGAAGGVADHGGAAADQGDGLVARHLQALHQGQGHKVAGGQAVGRAVKADVEGGLAVVDQVADLSSSVTCAIRPRAGVLVSHLLTPPAGSLCR